MIDVGDCGAIGGMKIGSGNRKNITYLLPLLGHGEENDDCGG
jgi:hypothetical protein